MEGEPRPDSGMLSPMTGILVAFGAFLLLWRPDPPVLFWFALGVLGTKASLAGWIARISRAGDIRLVPNSLVAADAATYLLAGLLLLWALADLLPW